MSRAADILALAARCATGADRAIDVAIELALEGSGYDYPADNWVKDAARYTASLDAAMSLVPSGWRPTISQHLAPLPHWAVRLDCWNEQVRVKAATPALALTAAALRAIAAALPEDE